MFRLPLPRAVLSAILSLESTELLIRIGAAWGTGTQLFPVVALWPVEKGFFFTDSPSFNDI